MAVAYSERESPEATLFFLKKYYTCITRGMRACAVRGGMRERMLPAVSNIELWLLIIWYIYSKFSIEMLQSGAQILRALRLEDQ
jgi:hypothetical protein